MLHATYTATKNRKIVEIHAPHRPLTGTVYNVSGKKEARQIAKQHNATPWNF